MTSDVITEQNRLFEPYPQMNRVLPSIETPLNSRYFAFLLYLILIPV